MTTAALNLLRRHIPKNNLSDDYEWSCSCGAEGAVTEPATPEELWSRHVLADLATAGCVVIDAPAGADLGDAGRRFDQGLASISIRVAPDRTVYGINPGGGETPLGDGTLRALFADAAAIVAAVTAAGLAGGGDDQ